ncbi:hypothetical protein [Nocardioides sp.]|uniref:hypothetical protein n=1 Tax=Nocardioides sp. TaxID=35761 RepID=UPI00199773F0|nr:hypothetical protein [Nocardioides sp.]MBC7275734.1 hypothetical protein [Nocardioides sp.]
MSEFITGIFNRHKNEQPTAGEGESIDTSTPVHAESLATAEVATETNPYVAEPVAEPVIEPFVEPGAETATEPTAEALAVDPLSDPEHLVTDSEETPAADVAELAAEEAEVGSGIAGEITEPEAVQTIDEAPLEGVDAEAPVADNTDNTDEVDVTAVDEVDEAPVEADDVAAADVETADAVADELVADDDADDADVAVEVAEEVAVEGAPEDTDVVTETADVTEVDAEDVLAPADAIESVDAEPAVVEPEGEVAAEGVAVEDVLVAPETAEVTDVEIDAESTEPTPEDTAGEIADAPEEVEEVEPVSEPVVAAEMPVAVEVDAVDTEPVADDLSEDAAEAPAQGFAPEPVAEPEATADSTVTGVLRVARESRGKSTVSEGLVERLVHHIVAKVDGVHAIDEEGTVIDIVDGVARITVSYVIVFGTQVKGNAVAIRTQVIEAVEDYFDIDVVAVDVNVSDFYIG